MRKYFLPLVVLCLLNGWVSAQGEWRQLLPPGGWNTYRNITSTTVDSAGNIYLFGPIDANDSYYNVWKWDGHNYSKLGGDTTPLNSYRSSFMVGDNYGNIYCSDGVYVNQWNGHSWSQLGALNAPYGILAICTDVNGNIYAAAQYGLSYTNFGYVSSYFVAEWNGSNWIRSDTVSTATGGVIMCADSYGNIYLGYSGGFNGYVSMWNGFSWTDPGNGTNPVNSDGPVSVLYSDRSGNVYEGGDYQVYKWYGNTWTELGGAYRSPYSYQFPNAVCKDDSGNFYANSLNAVMKFENNLWYEVGPTIPGTTDGNSVLSISTNHQGRIFATADVSPSCLFEYINLPPANMYVYAISTNANCNSAGGATADAEGGIPPYTYYWSNDSTTATIESPSGGSYSVTVTDSVGRQAFASVTVGNACQSFITGIAFRDVNGNCIFDSTDLLLPNVTVQVMAANGVTCYANTNANGQYFVAVLDTGKGVISASGATNCGHLSICNYPNDTLLIHTIGDTIGNVNLAISGSTFDLTLHPGWYSANPGFTKQYWVMPYNLSALPLTGQATIIFTYDSNLIYQSSLAPSPAVDTVAHTLTWVIDGSSIPYGYWDWNNERFICNFIVPSTLSTSYQLQSDFVIEPYIGDCDTFNNHLHFSEPVTGAHDPNSKSVSPSGNVSDADSVFTYTINFQNTGTDSTNFIVVKDTLSPYLNPASVVNMASSANYVFAISGTGILTWTFNPLRLPYQSIDSVGSKGFITFSIKLKTGLSAVTPVANSASIYFDYNAGIRTNTVADTVCTPTLTTYNISICPNSTYLFNGNYLDSAGTYSDTVTVTGGCDSIVIINLSLLPFTISDASVSAAICPGETYSFNGKTLDSAGIYTDTLHGFTVCDSVITLSLSIYSPVDTTIINASICPGATYPFFGTNESIAGNYIHILQNVHGCDSVITLSLSVYPPVDTTIINVYICPGTTYPFFGTDESAAGNYSHTLQNVNGCDSVITLSLSIYPPVDTTIINATICPGTVYTFFGTDESVAGNYSHTLQNINGCDSIVTLELSIYPPVDTTIINATICPGDSFPFFGTNESNTGTHSHTLQSTTGCDSVVTLHLTINPLPQPVLTTADSVICPNDSTLINTSGVYSSYLWSTGATTSNIQADTSGTYYVQVTDSNGCKGMSDSVYIPMSPTRTYGWNLFSDTVVISPPGISYQWYYDDTLITGATTNPYIFSCPGLYTAHITDSNGCTSILPIDIVLVLRGVQFDCTIGLPQLDESKWLTVYPNPATNELMIKVENFLPQSLTVYDMDGRKVITERFTPQVDISLLSSGSYFIEVKGEENVVERKRFVKL